MKSAATDLAEYLRGMDEIEAKWVAVEDQKKAERAALPWWRFWRRAMLDGELSGINRGLLELSMRRISACVEGRPV